MTQAAPTEDPPPGRTGPLAPQAAGRALALPAACYTDEDWLRWEWTTVFGRGWQLVAQASQLAGAGDHVVADIAGTPVIIVRNRAADGAAASLHALHNVCRHRAGPIATCDGRGATALVCTITAGPTALDGQLRAPPRCTMRPTSIPRRSACHRPMWPNGGAWCSWPSSR